MLNLRAFSSGRDQNNTVLLKFKGLNRIEDVEAFRNGDLYIPRSESIPLQQGEYFVGDLIGIRVEDETGKTLGTLVDVINTGSTPVYAVAGDGGHEILIPKVPEMILELKPEEGYMKVHLIPGLLDLNS